MNWQFLANVAVGVWLGVMLAIFMWTVLMIAGGGHFWIAMLMLWAVVSILIVVMAMETS